MKVKVTIIHKEVATVDVGDLPIRLVQNLLEKHEGSWDGNYGLGDTGNDEWTVESVEVEEVTKGK